MFNFIKFASGALATIVATGAVVGAVRNSAPAARDAIASTATIPRLATRGALNGATTAVSSTATAVEDAADITISTAFGATAGGLIGLASALRRRTPLINAKA